MGTNKAEELIKKLEILEDSCDSNLALVVNGYSSGVSDSIKIVKEYLTNRQSEIDELTKEVERLRKERHILLLDFYKGLKNIGRLYSDNTSEEIMMNDVSEFLTTH